MLLYSVLVFEVISFLVSGLVYFKREAPLYLKFFPIFLLITVIVEIIGFQLKVKGIAGIPMYNYFTVFEFVFYLFVLYFIIGNAKIKKTILLSGILYPVIAVVDIMLNYKYAFHTRTYTVGAILLVCLCMYYFYTIFKHPEFEIPHKQPSFWICFGLLFYYTCTIPLIGVYNYLNSNIEIERWIHALILVLTNFFLYASFSIAFFCFYKSPTTKWIV